MPVSWPCVVFHWCRPKTRGIHGVGRDLDILSLRGRLHIWLWALEWSSPHVRGKRFQQACPCSWHLFANCSLLEYRIYSCAKQEKGPRGVKLRKRLQPSGLRHEDACIVSIIWLLTLHYWPHGARLAPPSLQCSEQSHELQHSLLLDLNCPY